MDKVSVILTSYNYEDYLSEAIESVLNQTFKYFELIIIDDFSVDKSREIIEYYKDKDERIKIIFHNINQGIAKTLNEGLNVASGKYIAFLNSDDVWSINKLEKQLKKLEKDDNLIVWTEGTIIDKYSKPIKNQTFTKMYRALNKKKSGNIFIELLYENFILFSSVIFKRENLDILRFNEKIKFINDYLFWTELARKYNFYYIKEPLVNLRIHEKNTLRSDFKRLFNDAFFIRNYFLMKHSKDAPKKIVWFLLSRVIELHLNYGDKKKARPYIYNAFITFPTNLINFYYLYKSIDILNIKIKFITRWLRILRNYIYIFYINKIREIKWDKIEKFRFN